MKNWNEIGWFSDTSDLDSTIADLKQVCDVIVERVVMMDPNNAVLLLDRGVRKTDSPVLRHLRSRSPRLSIGLVATSSKSGWLEFPYRYTNRLTIEFKEGGDEALKVLKEYGLEFQDYAGRLTHAVADPGMGEGILEIAQKLKERPEVRSVSVGMYVNPSIR